MNIPKIGENLNDEQVKFLETFAKSCRHSIMEMLVNSQSGHPGGSLSSVDYLAIIYAFLVSQTGEKVVVSHGHISPAVYSVLAELNYIDKEDVVKNFRKAGSIFEGHVTRHVPGVWYGTGPLGIGISAACGFALAEKLRGDNRPVFALMGDGECQEGQVHEALLLASHHKLNNLIAFVDYNKLQLTDSLENIQDINIPKIFEAAGWHVVHMNAHNFSEIWQAIKEALDDGRPSVMIGNSIMGKGVDFMEKDAEAKKATWHGKAPKPEEAGEALQKLTPTKEEQEVLKNFLTQIKWRPEKAYYPPLLSETKINAGKAIIYSKDTVTDCRSAYGQALLDLAKLNPQVIALSADLRSSVMTKFVADSLPNQHIECGIAEQNMVSVSGAVSLDNFIPFTSTFGAFMSSRAKDQARVNDINYCNVKMVATHCGLSVGEDGPTHQAIDDMGSFLGMFNTMIIEPADPNQTDRIIRYVASHYGNFYVRMGRHKFPNILKENGEIFYDENYQYEYGKCDLIREGKDLTIIAGGATVHEAIKALESLKDKFSIEIVAAGSIKKFDKTLEDSIRKTGKILTVEDHNTFSGLGSQIAKFIAEKNIKADIFKMLGVESYQLSGKPEELYALAGIDSKNIEKTVLNLLS